MGKCSYIVLFIFKMSFYSNIDLLIGGLVMDKTIPTELSYTAPYLNDEVTWCAARAKPLEKWQNIFNIMPQWMWFAVLLIAFICISIYRMILIVFDRQQFDYFIIALTFINLHMAMSAQFVPNHLISRIFFLIISLFGMIFVGIFNNVLLEVLTWPQAGIQIETIEEMVSDQYRLLGTDSMMNLVDAQLQMSMEQCPSNSLDKCLAILTHQYSVAVLSSRQQAMQYNQQLTTPLRSVFCVAKNVINYPVTILVRQRSSGFVELAKLNWLILRMQDSGLLEKWKNDGVLHGRDAVVGGGSKVLITNAEVLNLEHCTGAWVAIVAGLALAMVTFGIELYVHRSVVIRTEVRSIPIFYHVYLLEAKTKRSLSLKV